jgi:alpha-glucosidase
MRFLAVILFAPALAAASHSVASPDGRVRASLDGASLTATLDGRPLLLEGRLGIEGLTPDWGRARIARRGIRSQWRPVYGERAVIAERYNELTLSTSELTIVLRAYDEGLAVRYRLEGRGAATIPAELTSFRFPAGTLGYEEYGTEGEYAAVAVERIKDKCERPLTLVLPGGGFASLGEAAVVDYPRMLLGPDGRGGVRAALDGPATGALPMETPWRFLVVGRRAGDLLENNFLVLNLSGPQALRDASWIRPGKVMREVTLSTKGGKALVDFAAARGVDYLEYDAGWYGYEYSDASDARTVSPDPDRIKNIPDYAGLDLPEVIRYAKSKGVGVILYVNRRALEKQLDALLPLYRGWGVAGMKFGFVNVGPQRWSTWLHEAIRKAAAHRLMVDVHDAYRPTGYTRTYPNLMTVEGVRGNEHMPTARHNATLPFTRAVAGSYDYTICWSTPRLKTTRAHQMAQSVVHYSPWQFLYWYDKPSDVKDEPALEFFKHLPTAWDETRVLAGEIGEYAVVARRKGAKWWVGAITNEQERRLRPALKALGGRQATLYCDGAGKTAVRTAEVKLDAEGTLDLEMAASGGCAAVVR